VLQNEYFTWLQRDRHSKAQELLYGEASRLVARNLGLGDPAEAPECLACHGFLPPPEIRSALEPEDGISCEACHGPASGWLGRHTEEGWTTADSVAAGMVDLASPQRRAALCLGCHAGDGERRVDHRLLAAGHPRLHFEMESFSAGMPEHWKPKPPLEEARAWAVGQAAALGAELSRIATLAEKRAWPELSLMSCGDCHHSLAEERWRRPPERRGPGAALGLPRRSPAHWTVLRPLVHRFAPEREEPLARALARLSREVGRLGGDPVSAAEAAREALAALDGVAPAFNETAWSEATLVELLGVLAAEGREPSDLASAEQLFWGVNTLAAALIRLRPEVLRGGLPDAVERLYAAVRSPHGIDEEQLTLALNRLRAAVGRLR
jgi:hypothetical protein